MKSEPTTFYSDGLKLSGTFFLPGDLDASQPQPLVVACSGFTGLCEIHPARFARYLTGLGLPCFGFDYRGFADSEGARGRVLLHEQVRDIIHAATFAAADPRFDERRLFLLGWGLAGGLVLDAARELPGVIGLIAANGFYNGKRVQRTHRGEEGLAEFADELADKRRQRVRTGEDEKAPAFHLYPLDEQSRKYVDNVLRTFDDYDAELYSYELGDSLMRWNPEAYAPAIQVPLLIAHGDANRLHPPAEAESLYGAYGGRKELYWLEGAGHTEFMQDDDPKFQALAQRIGEWINNQLNAIA